MQGGAGHGQIINGAVNGQRADVASRELQRLHDEAVGGDQGFAFHGRQGNGVGPGVQPGIGEMAGKDRLDQFPHAPAAVAVGEGDMGVPHPVYPIG